MALITAICGRGEGGAKAGRFVRGERSLSPDEVEMNVRCLDIARSRRAASLRRSSRARGPCQALDR
jgi:hypothetical protein